MIHVEFRRICGASKDEDRFLARVELPAVPDRGEVVNVDGEPYVVQDRGWAVGTNDRFRDFGVWCYLRLSPLQGKP